MHRLRLHSPYAHLLDQYGERKQINLIIGDNDRHIIPDPLSKIRYNSSNCVFTQTFDFGIIQLKTKAGGQEWILENKLQSTEKKNISRKSN